MSRAQLQLGSNAPNRRQNLKKAVEILSNDFHVLKISILVESADVTGGPTVFANQLLEIETELTIAQLIKHLKLVEATFGQRTPIVTDVKDVKFCAQTIPLDIDLLIYDSQILKPADLIRPYYRAILARGF